MEEKSAAIRRWLVRLLLGLSIFYALYLVVLATLWLLLHLGGFYFFWSYGLSAVCSYLLTDFTSRKLFDRVNIALGQKYEIVHAIAFIELIFSTAILGSLFNYTYQFLVEDQIGWVAAIMTPSVIVLSALYYRYVYRPDFLKTANNGGGVGHVSGWVIARFAFLVVWISASVIISYYQMPTAPELQSLVTVSALLVSVGALVFVESTKALWKVKDGIVKEFEEMKNKAKNPAEYAATLSDDIDPSLKIIMEKSGSWPEFWRNEPSRRIADITKSLQRPLRSTLLCGILGVVIPLFLLLVVPGSDGLVVRLLSASSLILLGLEISSFYMLTTSSFIVLTMHITD